MGVQVPVNRIKQNLRIKVQKRFLEYFFFFFLCVVWGKQLFVSVKVLVPGKYLIYEPAPLCDILLLNCHPRIYVKVLCTLCLTQRYHIFIPIFCRWKITPRAKAKTLSSKSLYRLKAVLGREYQVTFFIEKARAGPSV